MAHTDVHRPVRVQMTDPHARKHFYLYAMWPWRQDLASLRNLCGCRRCTGHHERRADRRRERHAGKVEIRRALRILEPRR